MNITIEQFRRWKKDPVTIEVLDMVSETKEKLNEHFLNGDLLFIKDSGKHLARLLGQREGLDTILKMSAESVVGNEDTEE